MRAPVKWIVGIDVRRRSDGAVAFAGWLHEKLQDPMIGVHVSGREPSTDRLDGSAKGDVGLRAELGGALAEAGLAGAFARVEVIEAVDPVGALEERCREEGAFGLIIGRVGKESSYAPVRLGAVVRRLLRGLVAPIWVVPPGLRAATIGHGPILVAVTPAEASVGAVRLAARLAAALGRQIVFVQVVHDLIQRSSLSPPHEPVEKEQTDEQREAEAVTHAWLTELAVEGHLEVRRGGTLEEILVATRRHDPAFVVCGTRRLGMLGRIFSGSLSSELAAHSSVPVLVVPPDAS